jgi:hypothetical protein
MCFVVDQPVRLMTLLRLLVVEGVGRELEAVALLVLGVRPFWEL